MIMKWWWRTRSDKMILLFAVLYLYGVSCATWDQEWIVGRPVNVHVGPENTIYCRVIDPQGNTVTDGFGRCNITLDRATAEHAGIWSAIVGTSDHSHAYVEQFIVSTVTTPVVMTSAEKDPTVFSIKLVCSIPEYDVYACKFRDPSGDILIANPGSEENYYNQNTVTKYDSNFTNNSCSIEITNPYVQDLGLWRCALDTIHYGTLYGFITVLCPWAMQDPDVAAVVLSEPILTAEREFVMALQGDSVTLSCSIQSAINYCYFRARNGTIYPVGEGTYNDFMQYVGSGFDAGECIVRFNNLLTSDSGEWSCHVGLANDTAPEQRAPINVNIRAPIEVSQYLVGNQLMVQGYVSIYSQLRYCRFVRIDGLGFTQSNMPEGYISDVNLHSSSCIMRVMEPTILDKHPWTVAAMLVGQSEEVYDTTSHTLDHLIPNESNRGIPLIWLQFTIFLSVGIIGLVGWVVVRKSSWYQSRCSAHRNSIQKVPLPDLPEYKIQPLSNNQSVNVTVPSA